MNTLVHKIQFLNIRYITIILKMTNTNAWPWIIRKTNYY